MNRLILLLTLLVSASAQDLNSITSSAAGTITAASSNCTGTSCVWISTPLNTSAISVQLSGTFVGTAQFESSVGGIVWGAIAAITGETSATAAGTWNFNVGGARYFRVRSSAYTSGGITVALGSSVAPTSPWSDDGTTVTLLAGRSLAIGTTVIGSTGTLVARTSVTSPLVIGGTGTTSSLTLRSTSGVGTTGADIIFQTGNNGATEAMRINNSGKVVIGGGYTAAVRTLDVSGAGATLRVNDTGGADASFEFTLSGARVAVFDASASAFSIGGDTNVATAIYSGGLGGGSLAAYLPSATHDFLIGGIAEGNYRLDVQKSGSTGTARFFDQTATTGATRVVVSLGAADSATTATLVNSGTTKSAGYQSSDGSAGVTGATCTAWKNGLCISL